MAAAHGLRWIEVSIAVGQATRAPVMAAAVAALLMAAPEAAAHARAGAYRDAAKAARGLDSAVAAHRLAARDARRHHETLRFAVRVLPVLPRWRASVLARVLADVAAARPYDRARALTLFSALGLNARYLRWSDVPARGRDVLGPSGVVYRSFGRHGLRFHPLASFGKLNSHATRGRTRRTRLLASALVARARQPGGALVWEYHVAANGGRPPWTSGLAQAVAAQALARAGYLTKARRAYAGLVRGLLEARASGPWVRLYSFDGAPILNAQLQAAVSIHEYARRAKDRDAARVAKKMLRAAGATLPHFDTGSWSTYALGGRDASLGYQTFVTSLLWKAARIDAAWRPAAVRFRDYLRKPPEIKRGKRPAIVYPLPADGFRDHATISFWLSKPATVKLLVAGETHTAWFGSGWQRMAWWPQRRPPGRYALHLVATDRVGNTSKRRLQSVPVRRDTRRPHLRVKLVAGRLEWHARDSGTPWIRLRLVLQRAGAVRDVRLGNVRHQGRTPLPVQLDRTWHLAVAAADSSGNVAKLTVGRIGRTAAGPAPRP